MLTVALTAVGAFVPNAVAQSPIVWDGPDQGSWANGANWQGGDPPTANDVAQISNGTVAYVDTEDAVCKTLLITNDPNKSGSGLRVLNDGILTVGDGSSGTSELVNNDNKLKIEGGGTLLISGVQTFQGTGAIRLLDDDDDGGETARIAAADDGDDQLILSTDCTSSPIATSCSIKLLGMGEVAVSLDNKAFVIADEDTYAARLHLTTYPKTTSGGAEAYWICENGGTMWIETTVTGSGHWHVRDITCSAACTSAREIDCNGTIEIPQNVGDGCVYGTGDVILEAGCGPDNDHQLKVKQNSFCTTGELTWRSVDIDTPTGSATSSPAILVLTGCSALFGLDDLTNCPSCGN